MEDGAELGSSREATAAILEEGPSEVDTTPVDVAAIDETKTADSVTSDQGGRTKTEIAKSSGNESFKENPYTFLSPDDSILISCMWVVWKRVD